MGKNKTSLVLEGGGMRGAYTAGALTWLLDNDIEFDAGYGISTGAVHLTNYLMKAKEDLFDFSVYGITDKRIVGPKAILRSGKLVDYDFLFDHILKEEKKYDITPLKDLDREGFIGIYELDEGKTIYHSTKDISYKELEASTSLPILGTVVKENGKAMHDGGITDMIPIKKAVEDGCKRHLIITTKPGDYKRKAAHPFVVWLMKVLYPDCKNISRDYSIRHLNYADQISLIKDLEKENEAVYVYPSRHSEVTRLGGSSEQLKDLFDLGYQDMEDKREAIEALFE